MSGRAGVAASVEQMARRVFGLRGGERVAAYADEVADMLQRVSSDSFERAQEPFSPPADDAPAEAER